MGIHTARRRSRRGRTSASTCTERRASARPVTAGRSSRRRTPAPRSRATPSCATSASTSCAGSGARADLPARRPRPGADFPPLRVDRDSEALTQTETERTRVVLAEDSVLLREGIARLLEDGGFEVVGQAGNADELLLKVRSYNPDVAIIDIRMPPTHTDEGLVAAKQIREKHPDTGVLVLSQYVEPATRWSCCRRAPRASATCSRTASRTSTSSPRPCAASREGGSALDPTVVSQLVGRRRRDDPIGDLTPREREVLGLMAEGRSNHAIAERARRDGARRREARHEHLLEAAPRSGSRGPPARARRAALPRG